MHRPARYVWRGHSRSFVAQSGRHPWTSHSDTAPIRDRYGNWYWIDDAEQGIQFLPVGERHAVSYWQIDDLSQRCEPANAGAFEPKNTPTHQVSLLRGLTVTHRHYLVVGDVKAHGIHIFDLHSSGAPLFLGWPDSVSFAPWDMAATVDGGLAILDKDNLRYWVLDADFRLLAAPSEVQEALFQPKAPAAPPSTVAAPPQPLGYALSAGAVAAPTSPISIEPGPDGTVLLLDTHPDRAFSIVYVYQGETQVAAYSLEDAVTVMDPDLGEGVATQYSLAAHDFVHLSGFLGETGPGNGEDASAWPSVLYLAERDGNQVMAFAIDSDQETLVDRQEFLPLRQWQAKALVRSGNAVYFDFADRWVSLQPLVECHYVGPRRADHTDRV